MISLDRRQLLGGALMGAAGARMPTTTLAESEDLPEAPPWRAIDCNVNLFQWPFRRLRYDKPTDLCQKLHSLGIRQAWAGSFEGLLHRDIRGVNERLAQTCLQTGQGFFKPIGSINPALQDWEEDLRRCHEVHSMPGVRLHPNYHGYSLADASLARCLALAAKRNMLVQIATAMEDVRTQHELIQVADVDLSPLPDLVAKHPKARILLLNYRPRAAELTKLSAALNLYFDTARVESTDGVGRLLQNVGSNRVLFGSHSPFLIPEAAMIRVCESNVTVDQASRVMQRNAESILGG